MESSRLGDKALSDSDCPTAIQHFTQALIEHPRSPTYYIKRSTAYSRLKPADGGPDPLSALHDAELALFLARERGKRELILSAQMRRGVALYQLERYGDAALVLDIIQEKVKVGGGPGKNRSEEVKDAMAAGGTESIRSMQKNGFEQELPIWVIKVKGKLNKLEDGDEKAKVTAVEYPTDIKVPTEKELKAQLEALKAGKLDAGETHVLDEGKGKGVETDLIAMKLSQSNNEAGPVSSAPPPGPAPDKVRHEWYQSHDSVVVTLYVKGAPKDKTDSELHNESVCHIIYINSLPSLAHV